MSKKYTYEQVKKFVEVESNSGCKLLSEEYQNNSTKMKFKCKCGEIFETTFASFKNDNKRQCSFCGRIHRNKYTYEYIQKYIKENTDCTLLTTKDDFLQLKYKNRQSNVNIKLKLICSRCYKNIFSTTFQDIKYRHKVVCNQCSIDITKNRNSKSYDTIKHYIENTTKCKLITTREEFNDAKDKQNKSSVFVKLKILCGTCKKEVFITNFTKFKHRNKIECNSCRNINVITLDKAKEIYNNNNLIPLFDAYINCETNMKCQDQNGFLYSLSVMCLTQDYNHSKFSSRNPYTIENIKLWLKLNEPTYALTSNKYVNIYNKLVWRCTNNHLFECNLNNFINNDRRCPICKASKGEKIIFNCLTKHKLLFAKEYTFNDLRGRNNQHLRFDFAIFEDKEKTNLKCLIEYDGELHYKQTPLNNDLKRQQYLDKKKDNYCKEHNIKLIRIPYWEFDNIEKILTKELNLDDKTDNNVNSNLENIS